VRYLRYWGIVGPLLWAQAVFIENADELGGTPEERVLRGNVRLRQDTLILLCAEARLREDGSFSARGKTQTIIGQSGTITAEELHYAPQKRLLSYLGSVRAEFPPATFQSPSLFYDRTTEVVFYTEGGTLRDTTGTIQSRWGKYQVPTETAYFSGKVRLQREGYIALTDSLIYETHAYKATFPLPVYFLDTARSDTLYARRAQWYRLTQEIYGYDSVAYWDTLHFLKAQAAYLHAGCDSGSASCEVHYTRKDKRVWAWGDSAQWFRDTLHLWENAALFWRDSAEKAFLQSYHLYAKDSVLWATGLVELLQPPLWARSDTLLYDTTQKTIHLRGSAWLGDTTTQLWADNIRLHLQGKNPDSAWAAGNVRLLLQADTALHFFHQVRSDSAVAAWDSSGKLHTLQFRKAVQVLYYQAGEKGWQGAHHVTGTALWLRMDSTQSPAYARISEHPQGVYYPLQSFLDRPLWLPKSRWLWPSERPRWPFPQK
jgi:lipopolysaccharide export system protein LptA